MIPILFFFSNLKTPMTVTFYVFENIILILVFANYVKQDSGQNNWLKPMEGKDPVPIVIGKRGSLEGLHPGSGSSWKLRRTTPVTADCVIKC